MLFPRVLFILTFLSIAATATVADPVIDVGSRRQLFVDGHLIQQMKDLRQILHHPTRREVAIKPDHPWEKYGVSYMVTFKDGDKFRAWYRVDAGAFGKGKRRDMTAYAESTDGIHWHKPKLGIIEFAGSKENNLVWNGAASNMAPFKDENPAAKPEEKYASSAESVGRFEVNSSPSARIHRVFRGFGRQMNLDIRNLRARICCSSMPKSRKSALNPGHFCSAMP